MRRVVAVLLVCAAPGLGAQALWNSSVRAGPQFTSFRVSSPVNEHISEFSLPFAVLVPVLPSLNLDVGTAWASARVERTTLDGSGVQTTDVSELNGLTDTQIRANYTVGQDLMVLTAGVNIPTGSATLEAAQLGAATRIGSDFLTFPVSGFGSGFGVTGGVALARPMGSWNVGFGASLRHSSSYEPFRDASGTTLEYQPGPEYRARLGADHPYGTGRVSFGITYSKFGDDKSNAATFNTGNRFIGQFGMSNTLRNGVDYSFVMWNLYKTSGTLIDESASPSGNITNAGITFGIRGPFDVGVEPSIETRLWTLEGSKPSVLGTLGMRFYVNRGTWAVVPGFGFSMGSMESATLTGYQASLGVRVGG